MDSLHIRQEKTQHRIVRTLHPLVTIPRVHQENPRYDNRSYRLKVQVLGRLVHITAACLTADTSCETFIVRRRLVPGTPHRTQR